MQHRTQDIKHATGNHPTGQLVTGEWLHLLYLAIYKRSDNREWLHLLYLAISHKRSDSDNGVVLRWMIYDLHAAPRTRHLFGVLPPELLPMSPSQH
jgi:hypothetical protein